MGVLVTISEAAKAQADALVAEGLYGSVQQALEAGLERLDDDWEDEDLSLLDVSDEDRAAIAEGLADAKAGRVLPADEVFQRLRAKFTAMAEGR